MVFSRARWVGTVAMVAVLAIAGGGCAKSDDKVSAGTTTAPPTTAKPTTTAAAKCTTELVVKAVEATFAGPTVSDLSCETSFAIATITAGRADNVAFLTSDNGAWALAASGGTGGDPKGLMPAGFPDTLYRTWKFRFDTRKSPPTSATTTTTGFGGIVVPADPCDPEDIEHCTTVPTSPPTLFTTTTTAPTTTTTAPTTTTPPPTVPSVSPFCAANPFNPNCLANPSYPGP